MNRSGPNAAGWAETAVLSDVLEYRQAPSHSLARKRLLDEVGYSRSVTEPFRHIANLDLEFLDFLIGPTTYVPLPPKCLKSLSVQRGELLLEDLGMRKASLSGCRS
jgi:hypothetical protein